MNETLKRLLSTCVGIVITALIGLFVNLLTQYLDKPIFKNENESEIKQCIIKPNEIDTTLENVGGLSSVKKELKNLMVLPLKHPEFFKVHQPVFGFVLVPFVKKINVFHQQGEERDPRRRFLTFCQ